MLRALTLTRADVPQQLLEFDAIVRAGNAPPSFEEYSARVGETLSPWRQTCYFDVRDVRELVDVANERFECLATTLGFPVPSLFLEAIRDNAVSGPDVLQIVLGIDASAQRPRLKYYLIFASESGATVERLRSALAVPTLPPALDPDSVYILGIDFGHEQPVTDFKVYVRLDPTRIAKVIRNLGQFDALVRGSRYLVFQHCMLGEGRQVYFHASSASVLEDWLARRATDSEPAAAFRRQIAGMNDQLRGQGGAILRPWIASFPWANGRLSAGPSNVYLHFSE